MVFEYADGGTLRRYLSDPSVKLDWLMRCKLGINVIDGLRYLHGLDILHKDLVNINTVVQQFTIIYCLEYSTNIFVISLRITY